MKKAVVGMLCAVLLSAEFPAEAAAGVRTPHPQGLFLRNALSPAAECATEPLLHQTPLAQTLSLHGKPSPQKVALKILSAGDEAHILAVLAAGGMKPKTVALLQSVLWGLHGRLLDIQSALEEELNFSSAKAVRVTTLIVQRLIRGLAQPVTVAVEAPVMAAPEKTRPFTRGDQFLSALQDPKVSYSVSATDTPGEFRVTATKQFLTRAATEFSLTSHYDAHSRTLHVENLRTPPTNGSGYPPELNTILILSLLLQLQEHPESPAERMRFDITGKSNPLKAWVRSWERTGIGTFTTLSKDDSHREFLQGPVFESAVAELTALRNRLDDEGLAHRLPLMTKEPRRSTARPARTSV